jgi:hypothetical protein
VEPAPSSPGSPRCPPHGRTAVATCARCGTFLCGECTELLGERALCAECLGRVARGGTASWGLTLTLALQFIALVSAPLLLLLPFQLRVDTGHGTVVLPLLRRLPLLNLVAGVVGLVLASRELRRGDAEDLSSRTRALTRATRGLAWVNLGFVLLQGLLLARLVLGLFAR